MCSEAKNPEVDIVLKHRSTDGYSIYFLKTSLREDDKALIAESCKAVVGEKSWCFAICMVFCPTSA